MTPPSLAARSAALIRSADTTKARLAPDGSRFTAQLETEFARQQLAENRTLIRVTSLLAIVLGVPRGVEQIVLGAWTQLQLGQFAVVLAASLVLAALAWGPGRCPPRPPPDLRLAVPQRPPGRRLRRRRGLRRVPPGD